MKSNKQKRLILERIEEIEKIIEQYDDLSKLSENLQEEYFYILESLVGLYMKIEDYQSAVNKMILLVEEILDVRAEKNENIISKDNINVKEKYREFLVSKFLNIGGCLIKLEKHLEAKLYLEQGYFIAIHFWGDQDERTLKVHYNLAFNEMIGIDFMEGERQLRYVYEDMKKYLGEENPYTIKVKNVLNEFERFKSKDEDK